MEKEKNGETAVYYFNKQKTITLATNPADLADIKSLAGTVKSTDGFIHKIIDVNSPVKVNIIQQIETKQLKRWFGDSKAVNKDGLN